MGRTGGGKMRVVGQAGCAIAPDGNHSRRLFRASFSRRSQPRARPGLRPSGATALPAKTFHGGHHGPSASTRSVSVRPAAPKVRLRRNSHSSGVPRGEIGISNLIGEPSFREALLACRGKRRPIQDLRGMG